MKTETTDSPDRSETVDCCVVGGGPAGMVLALLLARQGVEVLLLEAHDTFDRDFRGDSVHPSTLELMDQLGLMDKLLALPHARVADFPVHAADGSVAPPRREPLPTKFQATLQIPQAAFLELLAGEARRYPSFTLRMGARVEQLLEDDDKVTCGVRYRAGDGMHEAHASLVVGADGRFSKVRQLADMPVRSTAQAIDVLWLRLPQSTLDPERAYGLYPGKGELLVVMDRGDGWWQVGFVFAKGGYQRLRAAGIGALRDSIAALAPWLADRTDHLQDWKQTSLLAVEAGRVRRWYKPGLLLIGDAAHVMSPVAGVGINYAIQDAIVAANRLAPRLRRGNLRERDLAAVQRRREWATRLMQFLQELGQRQFSGPPTAGMRWSARLLRWAPLRQVGARLVAFGGLRPERVAEIRSDERKPMLARATGAFLGGMLRMDAPVWIAIGSFGLWYGLPVTHMKDLDALA